MIKELAICSIYRCDERHEVKNANFRNIQMNVEILNDYIPTAAFTLKQTKKNTKRVWFIPYTNVT